MSAGENAQWLLTTNMAFGDKCPLVVDVLMPIGDKCSLVVDENMPMGHNCPLVGDIIMQIGDKCRLVCHPSDVIVLCVMVPMACCSLAMSFLRRCLLFMCCALR